MIFGFALLAILIGTLMPVQAALNAELTRLLKHPYLGALVSLSVGVIIVALMVPFQNTGYSNLRYVSKVPPHLFLGGILGALFVGSSLFLIPRMGATAMIASFITGQLVASVIIDHFGLLGMTPNPVGLTRIIGVLLLFTGLFLVMKKTS